MKLNFKHFIRSRFPSRSILFTNSGRAALQAVIEDFSLKGTEMILPAFICEDVFSVLLAQNDIAPLLIDCPKNSFNISLKSIKKAYLKPKNNKNIKSVLIVHTFGLVNRDIEKISKWCRQKGIVLIEDCAHIAPMNYNSRIIGTFGDAAVFSFNKITSIPLGGAYVRNTGRINVKPKRYFLNNLDLYRLVLASPFGASIIRILKFFRTSEGKLKVNPAKIEVIAPPKILDFFSLNTSEIEIAKRKQIARIFYKKLRQYCPKLEVQGNFFQSFPLLLENRDRAFKNLHERGIKCAKMWTPIFKPEKAEEIRNADYFSRRIINIFINPRWKQHEAENNARIIREAIGESLCSSP